MTDSLASPYNRDLLDAVYRQYRDDPAAVDPTWRAFFAGMEFAGGTPGAAAPTGDADLRLQTGVVRLVFWYRQGGHLQARIDPLRTEPPAPLPQLQLETFGLSAADLDRVVDASMHYGFRGPVVLRDLIASLEETYCGTLGVEYMHIDSLEVRKWLAERMEPIRNRPETMTASAKYRILMTLHQAELFEKFLHTKYVGQKRFSLEGGETLIPVLDATHREGDRRSGRRSRHRHGPPRPAERARRTSSASRSPRRSSTSFEDNYLPMSTHDGDGDVKYHLGFSADVDTSDGRKVHLSVDAEPEPPGDREPGRAGPRAGQAAPPRRHRAQDRACPILIHGDAAFAGQGVIMETFNLMNLAGLPDRRHRPRRHQQPDRLHHQPPRRAQHAVLHRHREVRAGPRSST